MNAYRHLVYPGYAYRLQLRRHIAARAVNPVSRTDIFYQQSYIRTGQFQ